MVSKALTNTFSGPCIDKEDDGSTDKNGRKCNLYKYSTLDCGMYDDQDFDSGYKCCVCGGGNVAGKYNAVSIKLFKLSYTK